jgi:hypothetical protein
VNWKTVAATLGILPATLVIGTCLSRFPTLRIAYVDIARVYPDAITFFQVLVFAVVATGTTATYFYFRRSGATEEKVRSAVALEEHRLREQIEASLREKLKASHQQIVAERQAIAEAQDELQSQANDLKFARLQVKATEADALKMKTDAAEAFEKATEAAETANAVRDGVERVENVYRQLSQLLEKAIEDPVQCAAHLDTKRVERQIKTVQEALNRCHEYWEQMDTLCFGQVIEQDDTLTGMGQEAEQLQERVAIKERQQRKEVKL